MLSENKIKIISELERRIEELEEELYCKDIEIEELLEGGINDE